MQYNGPFDQPGDPNAVYVDGNSRVGTPGSIPPAAAFEYPQRELVNFFGKNKLTPANTDLDQLSRSFQNMCVVYGVDTGATNDMSVTLDPVPTARVPGMLLRVKKGSVNNTGALTLNIGLGVDPVVKMNGSAFNANDLPANAVITLVWDGSRWQAVNYLGVVSAVSNVTNNFVVKIPYVADTSVNANHIIAPFSPVITSVSVGKLILVKLNRSFIGGASDITVNSLPIIPVTRGDGNNPLVGDGFVGQILLLEFDGTNFQIVNSFTPGRPLPVTLVDQKGQGVHGGSFIAGGWRTRDLNTVRADPFGLVGGGFVSINNNQFTLSAGNWIVSARCPAGGATVEHQHRIWNVTDNAIGINGSHLVGASFHAGGIRVEYDFIDGMLSLPSTKKFEVQGICNTTMDNFGFGCAILGQSPSKATVSWSSPGPEVYTVVSLTKVS